MFNEIFDFFANEHGLTLLDGQIQDIKHVVYKEHYKDLACETDADLMRLSDAAYAEYMSRIVCKQDGMIAIDLNRAVSMMSFEHFSESQLAAIIENAIVAINKKKAERQGETVDVGFWDNKGEYIEDLQAISPEEKAEIFEYFEKTGGL